MWWLMRCPRCRVAAVLIGLLSGVLLEGGGGSLRADGVASAEPTAPRTRIGLQVFYDFRDDSGDLVRDRSGSPQPLDLTIENPGAVHRQAGRLTMRGKTLLRSRQSAGRLVEAIQQTGEFTLEVWAQPAHAEQSGPARIVTLSKNGSERNWTLGQDGDRYDIRFRTTTTSDNGIPSVSSPVETVKPKLTHVVYTRNRTGRVRVFVDGERRSEASVPGLTSSWDPDYRLALGNEHSGDRLWKGTYHLVAIFNRELSPGEVKHHFRLGAEADGAGTPAEDTARSLTMFEAQVAPLLSDRCLECHDAALRKGGLDLSDRQRAFAGGDSGEVISKGDAAGSLLWQSIEFDEMPLDRDPLTAAEKSILRKWIEQGAEWPIEKIDPALYESDQKGQQVWLRRLTVPEYIETVRYAVGVDIAEEATDRLPADVRADGFKNTAYNLSVDLKHVEAYANIAHTVAQRIDVPSLLRERIGKRVLPKAEETEKVTESITALARWIMRGPLDEPEWQSLVGLYERASEIESDPHEAVRYLLEAMLQSPRFLYRVERQRGDGSAWPVSEYELASRLSYLIWGGPPDRELLQAAEQGQLFEGGAFREQLQRMLQHERAVSRSRQFIAQWLDLDRLAHLQPNPDRFPAWSEAIAEDMREETLAFFDELVWQQRRPLADLLNAQVTFSTPRLAKLYGLPESAARSDGNQTATKESSLRRYDLSEVDSRGGLLTQGSILTVGGDEASMVARGLFVLHDVLRGRVKDPPPCVDTTPVPTKEGLTQRGIALERIANESCGGCHSKFEPLAFGLERFDGIGAFHVVDEHGNRLRQDGEILFPGEASPVAYETSKQLMDLLAASPRVSETLTWKLTQFALGRPLTAQDAPLVAQVHRRAKENGGTYQAVIAAIASSDLVRKIRTEPPTSATL